MEPLPGNGYIPRLFVVADMGVIEALASNGRLLCFKYSGF
jgi:hypothetical protein